MNDVSQREGYGLILSAHQDINRRVGLSARWNKSFERFNAGLRESLAAGFTFTGVGDYKDDWISIGYLYGKPQREVACAYTSSHLTALTTTISSEPGRICTPM